MKVSEAITKADEIRPNVLSEEQKAEWLYALDCDVAEMYGMLKPINLFPDDRMLLLRPPHDRVYVLYLTAMIDYYNEEMTLYANDMQMFNEAYAEAKAYFRRNHRPFYEGNWRVM